MHSLFQYFHDYLLSVIVIDGYIVEFHEIGEVVAYKGKYLFCQMLMYFVFSQVFLFYTEFNMAYR